MNDVLREVKQMMEYLAQGEQEVEKWVKKSKIIESVVRIPGDASARRYFRVKTAQTTYIVMKTDPFENDGTTQHLFLSVQKHLKSCGVRVPEILDADPALGFILLEDLGDITLLRHLQTVSNSNTELYLYQKVIDELVRLQVFASDRMKSPDLKAFTLRFDFEKLFWEMNHTIEHFYQGYLKRKITDEDLKTMRDGLGLICKTLEQEPVVLTHRDFHSRNIMCLKDDELVMIDFQDARLGPAQYDLVSLLKDSYYQLEEAQVDRLIDYYIMKYESVSHERVNRAHFREIFDLMSVQRNFKAIGSFASFLNRSGDPSYLTFIANTFENIRRTLLKYPKYAALREVLFHYYYF